MIENEVSNDLEQKLYKKSTGKKRFMNYEGNHTNIEWSSSYKLKLNPFMTQGLNNFMDITADF